MSTRPADVATAESKIRDASAGAYYPYVQTCPEGWVTVVP
jgi:hypothetical protein